MNDFELQRALRDLHAPREPRTDLWPAIATRIGAETGASRARHGRWLPLAAAAAVLLATAGGVLVLGLQRNGAPDLANVPSGAHPPTALPATDDALARSHGGDPRLAGAAVVLDAAHAELEQALEQRPDAVFLVGLLNRTNARRMQLERFGARAG